MEHKVYKKGKNHKNYRHGMTNTTLHQRWRAIKQRCLNPNYKYFKDYGGRGIKICERWNKFENFYEDMGASWEKGLSIDRINNDGDYSPENCRWATPKEQMNNTRMNVNITYQGRTQTVVKWAKEIGINHNTLLERFRVAKWSVEEALTVAPSHSNGFKHKRQKLSILI